MLMLGVFIGVLVTAIAAVPAVWLVVQQQVRRARAAERHAAANEQLAEIGAMTRGLAHEIRNPLSTIGLNAQLLTEGIAEGVQDSEERARLLRRVESVRREADRLKDILEDFLRYAGAVHVELAPHDLNAVVDEMIDFFLPQAQHHGIRLRAELAPTPLPVLVDAKLFKQALLNLMMNAVQAMAPDGPVGDGMLVPGRELILRTAAVAIPAGRVGVPAGASGAGHAAGAAGGAGRSLRASREHACEVHVIDTGPGLSPEQQQRIFQPYFTTKPGGSGLGLPTTKRLIEAHGGHITVHTEPGVGTDFAIRLPRNDAGDGAEQRATAAAGAAGAAVAAVTLTTGQAMR
jgi:signal transduction histidine kinase